MQYVIHKLFQLCTYNFKLGNPFLVLVDRAVKNTIDVSSFPFSLYRVLNNYCQPSKKNMKLFKILMTTIEVVEIPSQVKS